MEPQEILAKLKQNGVTISLRNGEGRLFSAGKISPDVIALVKQHRESILAHLRDPKAQLDRLVRYVTPGGMVTWLDPEHLEEFIRVGMLPRGTARVDER